MDNIIEFFTMIMNSFLYHPYIIEHPESFSCVSNMGYSTEE